MTALALRSCSSCAHYRQGPTACTGVCAHPAHRSTTDATIFQRDYGLGCYQGWGKDDWEARPEVGVAQVAALLVWGPFKEPAPAFDNLPPDLLRYLIAGVDDSGPRIDRASADEADDDDGWLWSIISGR